VQDHPGFSVARVVLSRELFHRGQVLDAWDTLEKAPMPLIDNVLAQKLRFKMALLFGDEISARSSFQQLKVQQGVDPEVKRLMDRIDTEGISLCRDSYKADLIARGIELRLPDPSAIPERSPAHSAANEKPRGELRHRSRKFVLEYELDEATRRDIDRFHVVPLPEVFAPGTITESGDQSRNAVELDSTTLAEIYAKQGFYAKALSIYRRLLRIAPHNDLLRMKVAELSRLEKEQRQDDQETDPVVYERMEVVEVIERQERFLRGLLDALNQKR
jgi:tetratricopeptide (TPR) repeat protein